MIADETPPPVPGRGRRALIFAGLVAVAVVAVFWGRGRKPPTLRPSLEHAASLSSRNVEACLSCHRPDGPARPRTAGHTPRQDCWNCHVMGDGGPAR